METLNALKSGQLIGQKRLRLSCNLREFPREILELADSLEILELSGNGFSTLPDDFGRLKNLRIAFFNDNAFECFPAVMADCPQLSMISFKGNNLSTIGKHVLSPALRWLILTDNQLEVLPNDIGKLSKLQKLMLAGNQLQSLPETMAACKSLELIRLAANRFQTLPDWLFSLPRLSWLAYAGNPCSETNGPCERGTEGGYSKASGASLPIIDSADLQQGDVLGQGASGVIYKGLWSSSNILSSSEKLPTDSATTSIKVAIKRFKGEITSDGWPRDEMRACMAAGSHPNLVTVLGRLSGSEAADTGLVFSFISSDYTNLGEPPSLESCTRDTYPANTAFTLPVILKIVREIASAVTHLHRQGIMHGDLYAHNILVNTVGESYLGDFGAASFYDQRDEAMGQALERLEVRAFGCLLEDLLDRHMPNKEQESVDGRCQGSGSAIAHLRSLQQACLHPNPSDRPLFAEIFDRLNKLGKNT